MKIIKEMLKRTVADLWISRMFWTQDLKSFTVGFALRIVNVAEESSGSEKEEKCVQLRLLVEKLPYKSFFLLLTLRFL